MIIEEYRNELNDLLIKLKSIKNLRFNSVNIYGSACNDEMFVKGISDIDVIVMYENFDRLDKNKIIKELNEMNLDFKEKRPIVIKDNLCERIEFYIVYEKINIDVTICSGLVPNIESLEKDAWYDGFEALMGGVYIYSTCIYGKIPDYDLFIDNYYPFYNDNLRKKRLDILANRIKEYCERIKKYLDNNSPELIDHLFKIKKFFIKFLFIYYRTYYWTPEKHTYYQLTKFLNLPEEEKRIICFMDGNYQEIAYKFLDLCNKYIYNYEISRCRRLNK